MSQKFYLNDLMADANVDDMQEIFEHTMKQYVQIRKESLLDIEKYIIIGDKANKIITEVSQVNIYQLACL